MKDNHYTPKTIVFTGASTGFGRLTAALLIRKGHILFLGIRGGVERFHPSFAELFSLQEREQMLKSGQVSIWDLQMENPQSFSALAQHIKDKYEGRLDILVNNAGAGFLSPIELEPEVDLRRVVDVNFFGPVALTKQLLPFLIHAKGRVLNVTSILGLAALPFYGAYVAAKHALEGYSESLGLEMHPFGVQVGVIEPGAFRTAFNDTLLQGAVLAQGSRYKGFVKTFVGRMMGDKTRGGSPDVVARKIVKLCAKHRLPAYTLVGVDARSLFQLRRWMPRNLGARISRWVVSRWLCI